MFDIVPLTIVIDYLKDDVGEKMEMFMNLHKIIEKNIQDDFEEIWKEINNYKTYTDVATQPTSLQQ